MKGGLSEYHEPTKSTDNLKNSLECAARFARRKQPSTSDESEACFKAMLMSGYAKEWKSSSVQQDIEARVKEKNVESQRLHRGGRVIGDDGELAKSSRC